MKDTFSVRDTLEVNGKKYAFASLTKLGQRFDLKRLPYSMKILLENLLRHEDGVDVTAKEIEAVATWDSKKEPDTEIAFMPARVLLQDFTGVPCVVDLAAMRDAMKMLGGDPTLINPLSPAELVIDHSVQVDVFGSEDALERNVEMEFKRNQARYSFLRWGQKALTDFKVVPPRTGIVHQVNLEYLARVVMGTEIEGQLWAYPDTLFGTDSHTTMVNGLGVLGWGVGGIEAEAAMLGQPSSMLIPQVVGLKLLGQLPEGATATDLVLTVTELLRRQGVVGKFVEFFGPGLKHLALADRATLGNMAPEYGATCAICPIDVESLKYLRLSGRSEEQVALVEAYAKVQGLWHDENSAPAEFSVTLELDLASVKPSMAGPKRPQDHVLLTNVKQNFNDNLGATIVRRNGAEARFANEGGATAVGHDASARTHRQRVVRNGQEFHVDDGAVVIAAITSCTNTSNPAVMLAAGLLAKKAAAKGLKTKPWVKTSLAPGSKVVTDYLEKTGLLTELDKLGFYLVGYGCTTCIGNSGPLPEEVSKAISDGDLTVGAVLSGNRNFEGRVHAEVKMNYLASPPLVVAYALAGSLDVDLTTEPLGQGTDGKNVYLKDVWPSNKEISDLMAGAVTSDMFKKNYADVFKGDERWSSIASPDGDLYAWDRDSTYIKNPPYFDGMTMALTPVEDIHAARCLGLFGDSITTDHISPAGAIKKDSPAGRFLISRGVQPIDFNSYGSRRGNDDVMVRGTFANIRIKNQLLDGVEGGFTRHIPSGEQMSIYDAAMKYKEEKTPLVVIAGKEYGTGSSRDWAAKGTLLLGIKAVIAESFERIHRSNLVGMGVLPCTFKDGENAKSLGLTGNETFDLTGLDNGNSRNATVTATAADGSRKQFSVNVMLLTPKEREFFRHGGILQYVLRQLAGKKAA
ncbi:MULTISPECIES: aconitate hydratase AcnA [Rhodanobacter]|uniref:Aconitate hydratase n=1 Tax=Rhodanobacter denitrificans TaxID=666685 RepID=M4NLQ2_9GAMM|nr:MULTISPECIES: aconitate hydratase AcnA [Rhodanobacter]AGG88671.1 aconitate hydratase 1 [Rhodanobacter denitrificans]KZC20545.1 aconitate hydratase [Rhodanobacter denitrificans]UJJ52552.1 aconitate hydratase AcnA [Rhodanobacter denitrificans]UJJ58661.1 aconitate hydratase AcnA [Rhodanobacter denitrificans]UJM87806.1 aconitate hydratase AcnA [Rhodanobacter denitrificans]